MEITGVILAGGAGQRVGGRDKGLLDWHGKPLIQHVYDRFNPQVDQLVISCNRNLPQYGKYTDKLVADTRGGHCGPLAGLEAVAEVIDTEWVVIVACDIPRLPSALCERLMKPLLEAPEPPLDIAYVNDGQRDHYVCMAFRLEVLHSLTDFLDSGERAVKNWLKLHQAMSVDFSDYPGAFRNINNID